MPEIKNSAIGLPPGAGLRLTETDNRLLVNITRFEAVEFNPEEQLELLEALARIHGFALIKPEQREQLIELLSDLRATVPGRTAEAAYAGVALASAVSSALDLVPTIPKEV